MTELIELIEMIEHLLNTYNDEQQLLSSIYISYLLEYFSIN